MRARTALAAPVLAATLTSAALLLSACGGAGAGGAGGSSGGDASSTGTATATPAAASSSSPGGSGHGTDDNGKDETGKPGGDDKGGATGHHGRESGRVKQRCHTSQLRPSFRSQAGGSGAGQRHALVVLTNTSMTTCTVYGYGGFQLYTSGGTKVPTRLVRDSGQRPVTLTVRPGQAISSQLSWGVVPTGSESGKRCEATPTVARVTPPDERDNRSATWEFGAVCGHGRIVQGAYRHVSD